jgi:hypothetical protein
VVKRTYVVASLVLVGFIAGGIAGAAIDHSVAGSSRAASTTTSATTSPTTTTRVSESDAGTTTTTTTTPAPVTYQGSTAVLPISDSAALSVPESDPYDVGVIQPASCTVTGSTVTARGTVGFVDEAHVRAGDVIELYVWGGPGSNPVQLVDLTSETPAQLTSPWQITAPIEGDLLNQLDASSYCNVALQSTHAFMYAGSAGS